MTDELLDLVNEKDEVIGTVWKSEAHKNPKKIHREIAVVILTRDKNVLLQKRSLKKEFEPGRWQLSASGHVIAGEKPIKSAERELFEEVGIDAKLKYVYKFKEKYLKETRFFYVYYVILENSKVKLKWNKNEVEKLKWIKLSDLAVVLGDEQSHAEKGSYKIIKKVIKILSV